MFQKAKRVDTKFKVAMTGPSGSGKTYSALTFAKGFGGKIAVLDTENMSSNLYADKFEFDVVPVSAPYSVEKYISIMQESIKAKYDVLIIDSLSHAWTGSGGVLDQKTQLDAKGGNSYTNWARFTPLQERLIETIKSAPINIIATMRSKQGYVIKENEQGKKVPVKVGLEPIQRDGVEYEFWIVFDMLMNHHYQTSKDRTGMYDGKSHLITEDTGKQLKTWITKGV